MDGCSIVEAILSRIAYLWIAVHFIYVIISTGINIGKYSNSSEDNQGFKTQYSMTLAILIVVFPFFILQIVSVIYVGPTNTALI